MEFSRSYMTVRLGFLVAASIAAFAVKLLIVKTPMRPTPLIKPSENVQELSAEAETEDEDIKRFTYFNDGVNKAEDKEKEEKEEVNLINGKSNAPQSDPSNFEYENFPEFKNLLSGDFDFTKLKEFQSGEDEIEIEEKIYNKPYEDELEGLRNLVNELREREMKLEGELLKYYGLKEKESNISELQRQLKMKTSEINILSLTINSLQSERKKLLEEVSRGESVKKELEVARSKIKELLRQIQLGANETKGQLLFLKQQVSGLQSKEDNQIVKMAKALKELEIEVIELKRMNKELQHEKRELLTSLSNTRESEMAGREEVNNLKNTNEELLKQIECFRTNRFSEVEELVYLRWVNACLRIELRNYQTPSGRISARDLKKIFSPKSQEKAKELLSEYAESDVDSNFKFLHPSSPHSEDSENSSVNSFLSGHSKKSTIIQRLKKLGGKGKDDLMLRNAGDSVKIATFGVDDLDGYSLTDDQNQIIRTRSSSELANNSAASSFRLMSKSVESVVDERYGLEREMGIKEKAEQVRRAKLRDFLKEPQREETVISPPKLNQIKKKVAFGSGDRPDDSMAVDSPVASQLKFADIEKRPRVLQPPPKSAGGARAGSLQPMPPPPLLAGSSHGSLVSRSSTSNVVEVRNNMIGEIEDGSTFLSAVKADVETRGDFVRSLATEVRAASFDEIEDLVAFVNWLDEELSFLVDERAVLKNFDWPEEKVDALRVAAFEYQDLLKLEKTISSFTDDPGLSCETELKKMYKLLEKAEQSVYALLRTRDMEISLYQEFGIPTNWLQDSGTIGKIKLSSVQLARKYMKRVASELDTLEGPEKERSRLFLVLQGVRFAFRVHQFAGEFDSESMKTFEELRSRIHTITQ